MYTQFFHLSAQPFSIAPDPRFMYESIGHQEGLAHLLYGIQVGGGFVALTGEVGTGKTLLCHCLLQQLPAMVDMALILNPRLDAIELLASICDELGIQYTSPLSLKCLVDALNKHLLSAHALGKRTVVMIDEAQNLSLDVLEQIRLLTNLETTTDKLLQIILVGQPELQTLLNRPALRQLNQRITARYHLQGLDVHETKAYIQHRLGVCSGDVQLFKASAIRKIFKLSGGIPRLINRLCDRALLGAYALERQQVDATIVTKAAKEIGLVAFKQSPATVPRWRSRLLWTCLAVSLLLGLLDVIKRAEVVRSVSPPVSVAVVPPVPTLEKPSNTLATLSEQHTSLSDALGNALSLFSKTNTSQKPLDCEAMARLGLACFLDKTSWKEMLALNRPVILELEVTPQQKIFALLTGVSGDNVVFEQGGVTKVSLKDVLQHWNGYYLLVWEPPVSEMKELVPDQVHAGVLWLRQQLEQPINLPAKAVVFDKALALKIMNFQKQHQLEADGVVGARTFIHLQNQYQAGRYRTLTVSN
ncbi:MAG: AAA family ATPase [Methylococcales bacterium]|nr:AAA family ATPase [Methylococcales bacterium]